MVELLLPELAAGIKLKVTFTLSGEEQFPFVRVHVNVYAVPAVPIKEGLMIFEFEGLPVPPENEPPAPLVMLH